MLALQGLGGERPGRRQTLGPPIIRTGRPRFQFLPRRGHGRPTVSGSGNPMWVLVKQSQPNSERFEANLSQICAVILTIFQVPSPMMGRNTNRIFPKGVHTMLLSRFLRDRKGSVVPLLALSAIPIMGAVAASVDYSRAATTRSAMQSALDATGLMLSKSAQGLTAPALNKKANE